MTDTWDIREATPDDGPTIGQLHRDAFGDHGVLVAELVDAIVARTAPDRVTSLVALDHDRVIGHVLLSPSILDAPTRLVDVQVLSPIAVAPDRQRRGVGRALIAGAMSVLDATGTPLVFLEGDPKYYSRVGFEPGAPLGFRKPSLRIPDAAFQVRRLSSYEPSMSGTLVYSQVFWDLDAVGLRD